MEPCGVAARRASVGAWVRLAAISSGAPLPPRGRGPTGRCRRALLSGGHPRFRQGLRSGGTVRQWRGRGSRTESTTAMRSPASCILKRWPEAESPPSDGKWAGATPLQSTDLQPRTPRFIRRSTRGSGSLPARADGATDPCGRALRPARVRCPAPTTECRSVADASVRGSAG